MDSHSSFRRKGDDDHAEMLRKYSDSAEDAKLIKSAIAQHERHDHAGEPLTKVKLKSGGRVDGSKARHRLDRPGRAHGGRTKAKGHHTTVNVVMPQGQDKPVPVPVPGGGGAPMGGPPPGAGAPPPRPPMMPPGAGAPGMGGGPPPPPMMRARGGKVPHLTGGSGSGEGRIEKNKSMGVLKGEQEDKPFSGHEEDKSFTGNAENKKGGGRVK